MVFPIGFYNGRMIRISTSPEDHPLARRIYAEYDYPTPIRDTDLVFVAYVDEQPAGVVRLCDEESVTVLRGMRVLPQYQRQGVGTQLLQACVPALDKRTSYCIPYLHLVHFYAFAGFVVAQPEEVPAFLAERLAAYRREGKDVLLMKRIAAV